MKQFLRFIDLLLYSSLLTAGCATGLCMATERFITQTRVPLITPLHALLFGGTLLVYNTPRILRRPQLSPQPLKWWYLLSFVAGLSIILPFMHQLPLRILLACPVLAVLTFSYSLPLLPFTGRKSIREYGWPKILVLAGVWTATTAVLPMLYWNKSPVAFPFELLLRFVFIFSLCIVFDIRDIQTDTRNKIETLPIKLGLNNSYKIINAALLLFVVLSILQYARFHDIGRLVAAVGTSIITYGVVLYLKKKPTERAYMVLADGVMLVYALLALLK